MYNIINLCISGKAIRHTLLIDQTSVKDFIMNNITICVSFIAVILGISFPILFGVVSRLDDKYSSLAIIELFRREREYKFFIGSLISSLVSILLWMLKLHPLIKINILNYFIGISSELLLILSTVILIISFFTFVNKVLIYYTPTVFSLYLIQKHNNINDIKNKQKENKFKYFVAISDILYCSISNKNEKIVVTIYKFMDESFKIFRDKYSKTEVVYPNTYYEVVSKTIEELAPQKNKRLTFLEYGTAGSVWLLGEFANSKISEITYGWIWSNLQLALKYDRDDYVIYHWEQAHNYLSYSLKYLTPNYLHNTTEITNQEEINERKACRDRFLEFHDTLGGLLLYKGRYHCIKRAFTYTQSIPPQYELLPDTMNEIFRLYFYFRDPYEMEHSQLSNRYYFPELEGLNSNGIIKKWICQYVALLFIRQYSIFPHSIRMRPLDPPIIPVTQREKRVWINNLDYFKYLVDEVQKNKELLSTIGLDFVTDEWCKNNNHPNPIDFIEKVKKDVIASFEGTEIEQPISKTKVQSFKDTTAAILKPIFEEYEKIDNTKDLPSDLNKRNVDGVSHIIDKSGFADDQGTGELNFDSFLPEIFVNKYRYLISEIFVLASSQKYLLNSQDIIPAIRRIGINVHDYVIVSFGVHLDNLKTMNSDDSLKTMEIINFNYRNYQLVGDSLFILKKDDLPKLIYREIELEVIKKYSLEEVIKEYNLYVTVVDLNESTDLRNSFKESWKEKDLRTSVFMAISLNLEVQWKKNIQCIQIKQASEFREGGIINSLNDIKPI